MRERILASVWYWPAVVLCFGFGMACMVLAVR
jgi:hypothetical protein